MGVMCNNDIAGRLWHINYLIYFSWHYLHSKSRVKKRNSWVRWTLPVPYTNLNWLPKQPGWDHKAAAWPSVRAGTEEMLHCSWATALPGGGLPGERLAATGRPGWCNIPQRRARSRTGYRGPRPQQGLLSSPTRDAYSSDSDDILLATGFSTW